MLAHGVSLSRRGMADQLWLLLYATEAVWIIKCWEAQRAVGARG